MDGPPAIFASLAVHGPPKLQVRLVENILFHVQPVRLVVHVSNGSSNAELRRLRTDSVLVNPEQHAVVKYSPSILGVHISNIRFLERHAAPSGTDKLILLAGNNVFFRSCVEHLRSWPLSFVGGQPTDSFITRLGEYHPGIAFPSSEWESTRKKVKSAQADDNVEGITKRPLRNFMLFVAFTVSGRHGVPYCNHSDWAVCWGRNAIAQMPHEGTFFPMWLVREFVEFAVNSSDFDPSRMLDAGGTHGGGTCAFWDRTYGCAYEEVLLPTHVLQVHPSLALAGAPPAISRLWLHLDESSPNLTCAALMAKLTDRVLLTNRSYVSGYKLISSLDESTGGVPRSQCTAKSLLMAMLDRWTPTRQETSNGGMRDGTAMQVIQSSQTRLQRSTDMEAHEPKFNPKHWRNTFTHSISSR